MTGGAPAFRAGRGVDPLHPLHNLSPRNRHRRRSWAQRISKLLHGFSQRTCRWRHTERVRRTWSIRMGTGLRREKAPDIIRRRLASARCSRPISISLGTVCRASSRPSAGCHMGRTACLLKNYARNADTDRKREAVSEGAGRRACSCHPSRTRSERVAGRHRQDTSGAYQGIRSARCRPD